MDVVTQPPETGARHEDLDHVCQASPLGKEVRQRSQDAGERGTLLEAPLGGPVPHDVLESLRRRYLVGLPAPSQGVVDVPLELLVADAVEVERTLHDAVAQGLVAEELLVDAHELGRVAQVMLEKLRGVSKPTSALAWAGGSSCCFMGLGQVVVEAAEPVQLFDQYKDRPRLRRTERDQSAARWTKKHSSSQT